MDEKTISWILENMTDDEKVKLLVLLKALEQMRQTN